ncbi:MAG: SDR family NAD(P)-dependent oxidoreductase [Chloroflexi bacterium]|nr:SDR family NAD(P)-dependent oxidoreductase [Chloroflexota bacterium]
MSAVGRFGGQVAIVVGGGQDVGLGVAMRMGREGASIVLVEGDRVRGECSADLLDAEGIEGRLLLGDPADPAAAKWAMTTAKLVWGRVDVVVYADPMEDVSGPLHAVGPKILDALYRNDVRGPLQYCKAVMSAMMERGYGRIVMVASEIGMQGQAGRSARSASQAALIGLTKAVAMSVVDTGVLVNAVVRSDAQDLTEGAVSTVCWLASSECSFTTGMTFEVGGGQS